MMVEVPPCCAGEEAALSGTISLKPSGSANEKNVWQFMTSSWNKAAVKGTGLSQDATTA